MRATYPAATWQMLKVLHCVQNDNTLIIHRHPKLVINRGVGLGEVVLVDEAEGDVVGVVCGADDAQQLVGDAPGLLVAERGPG